MANDKIQSTRAITAELGNGSSGITQFGRVWKDPNTKTCRVQVSARKSTDISTNDILATIPSGFRPTANYALYGYFYTGGNLVAAYYGIVNAAGDIKQSLGNSIREVFLVGEYPYE